MRNILLIPVLICSLVAAAPGSSRTAPSITAESDRFIDRAIRVIDSQNKEAIGNLLFDEVVIVTCKRGNIEKEEIINKLLQLTFKSTYHVQLKAADQFKNNGYEGIKMLVELDLFPSANRAELWVSKNEKVDGKYAILAGKQVGCR